MSNNPPEKRTTGTLSPIRTAPLKNPNNPRSLESLAGVGLRRPYWVDIIDTPLGKLSRRAISLTALGMLLVCLVLAFAAWWRITSIPAAVVLPFGDAQTVMTHTHANFSAPSKDAAFAPFYPSGNWRFTDAYTFGWLDASGGQQQAIILSYARVSDLLVDYNTYTRSVERDEQSKALARNPDVVLETRSKPEYGSEWRGLRAGNVLLLMSPGTNAADQQELSSHFISIMAANHREVIPTPTPR